MKWQNVFFPALILRRTLVSSWALARLSTAMAKKTLSRVSVVAEVKEKKTAARRIREDEGGQTMESKSSFHQ